MSSTGITVTDALAQKMAYLNQSQAVHMQNIAGANVPGFQARELAPFTFSHALTQASALKVTDPRHIVPASMAGANAATVKVKSYATMPNGNNVDVEQETLKSSRTNVEYQLVTSLYKKFGGLEKIALKGSPN